MSNVLPRETAPRGILADPDEEEPHERMTSSGETTYVALVRGINVGRAKPVAMSDLRETVESAGFEDVRTLLRSGNVVCVSRGSPDEVGRALETAIEARLRFDVRVVVRTAAELEAVVDANLIAEAAAEGSNLHVMFLAKPLSTAERRSLEAADFGTDVVRPAGREIYVWYRHGMSGSDTATRLGRLLEATVTDRNWNTVNRLSAMAAG